MEIGPLKLEEFPGTLQATSATSGAGSSEDGSLGVRIISRYNFTLNLADRVLHLIPNIYYSLPKDFMIGKWYMGFNEEHEIITHYYTEPGEEKQALQRGDIITSINGISSKSLEKNPEKLKRIQALPLDKISFTVKRNGSVIKI